MAAFYCLKKTMISSKWPELMQCWKSLWINNKWFLSNALSLIGKWSRCSAKLEEGEKKEKSWDLRKRLWRPIIRKKILHRFWRQFLGKRKTKSFLKKYHLWISNQFQALKFWQLIKNLLIANPCKNVSQTSINFEIWIIYFWFHFLLSTRF